MTSICDRQSIVPQESFISKYQKILKEIGRYNIAGSKARILIIDQLTQIVRTMESRVNERINSRERFNHESNMKIPAVAVRMIYGRISLQ